MGKPEAGIIGVYKPESGNPACLGIIIEDGIEPFSGGLAGVIDRYAVRSVLDMVHPAVREQGIYSVASAR
jgi:hypothetical protein